MPRRLSIIEYAVRRLGIHRGALAAAKVGQFAIAAYELGHVPTIVEYAEWWAISERTGWSHAAVCEELLGDQWRDVVALVARGMTEASSSPSAVVGRPLPAAIASA